MCSRKLYKTRYIAKYCRSFKLAQFYLKTFSVSAKSYYLIINRFLHAWKDYSVRLEYSYCNYMILFKRNSTICHSYTDDNKVPAGLSSYLPFFSFPVCTCFSRMYSAVAFWQTHYLRYLSGRFFVLSNFLLTCKVTFSLLHTERSTSV